MTTVFAAHALMANGNAVDLLLFEREVDAFDYIASLREHNSLIGFDALHVVRRTVIGPPHLTTLQLDYS